MQAYSAFLLVLGCFGGLRAQGTWTASFDHVPNGSSVHPASDSIANPSRWITQNLAPANQVTPGQGMNTVHAALIPSGVHRGEVLVWDGNLTNYGTRAYQPWSIVNPYWPALNPNFWPGQTTPQYRFHNATIAMPAGQGELFCASAAWLPDGRLFVAGGTKRYPIQTGGGWEGANYVWMWDNAPVAGSPFGKWYPMTPLEAGRWYPTVIYDGTLAYRVIVIGGSDWTQTNGEQAVNSYEVVRFAFNSVPAPSLLGAPNDFDRKSAPTQPNWPSPFIIPLPSQRQYWGPTVPYPFNNTPGLEEYPRVHALGILDQMPATAGTAPRILVSGSSAWGIRLVHDIQVDPTFGTTLTGATGQGFEIGQSPANNDSIVEAATALLLPGPVGGISSQVARIGGGRGPFTNGASDLVETVNVSTMPSSWQSSGTIPHMLHRRFEGNVVILPTGELFAIGGTTVIPPTTPGPQDFNLEPELLVGGTTWAPMAVHAGARDYHSTAILLPDARVFVCGGENRKNPNLPNPPGPGQDYAIWEPPYFGLDYGSIPPTGITVKDDVTGLPVPQDVIQGMSYGRTYRASWTNTLEPGIEVNSVVMMRPAALTHHDDGGQRMARLVAWHDEDSRAVNPTMWSSTVLRVSAMLRQGGGCCFW